MKCDPGVNARSISPRLHFKTIMPLFFYKGVTVKSLSLSHLRWTESSRVKSLAGYLVVATALLCAASGCQQQTNGPAATSSLHVDSSQAGEHDAALVSPQLTGQRRHFNFVYEVTVDGLPAGKVARLWIPMIQDGPHQQVTVTRQDLPGQPSEGRDQRYGNRYWFTEAQADEAGMIQLSVVYDVVRTEVTPQNYAEVSLANRDVFLESNQLVPVGGKPVERLLDNVTLPSIDGQKARLFYERVYEHVDYDKPVGATVGTR